MQIDNPGIERDEALSILKRALELAVENQELITPELLEASGT